MNKTAIKGFAIWARTKLIADITYKAGLMGITEKGIALPLPRSSGDIQFFDIGTTAPYAISGKEIVQRRHLEKSINDKARQSDHTTAFETVVEEVAYTWFNRLIAIRFMEMNDYLPSRVRVLSSESPNKTEPDLVTNPFEANLDFSANESELITSLKLNNKLDELFRMLFVKQCNELNAILPALFETTSDYSELLLNISYTDNEGIVSRLVNDIAEKDFQEQVQIIGWLYQYYNTELKDETFALLKKKVKITKERVPAATQLFTPDWIVRYMVENSIGRLWLEGHPDDKTKEGWKYYLEEAEQDESVKVQLREMRESRRHIKPEDIKVIDPCMGSGHILVYAFDVLMQIYESQGYSRRDAAVSILQNNIHGLDIDKRAYQLAYFSLMMKGRENNRRIFSTEVTPQVYYPSGWQEGEEFGSLNKIAQLERKPEEREGQMTFEDINYEQELRIWNFKRLLADKYDVVVTNPPYMGGSGMNGQLAKFAKDNYPDSKSDMFAMFLERGLDFIEPQGFNCMVTMQSWMFLSSYEKLRQNILATTTISNLMHMENMVMGIAFGTVVANLYGKHIDGYKGCYNHVELSMIENNIPKVFPPVGKRNVAVSADNFTKIPGSPISYWASENIIRAFEKGIPIGTIATARNGMKTGNNDKFVRLWWEMIDKTICFGASNAKEAISSNAKWFPYNKGGEYRKWFGNNDYIVNWQDGGREVFDSAKADKRNVQDYPIDMKFSKSISWSLVTSGKPAFRFKEYNLSDIAGMSLYSGRDKNNLLLGFCNTMIALQMLQMIAPTLNFQAGDIARLPILSEDSSEYIDKIICENIELSRIDWDYNENSWDFNNHPLV